MRHLLYITIELCEIQIIVPCFEILSSRTQAPHKKNETFKFPMSCNPLQCQYSNSKPFLITIFMGGINLYKPTLLYGYLTFQHLSQNAMRRDPTSIFHVFHDGWSHFRLLYRPTCDVNEDSCPDCSMVSTQKKTSQFGIIVGMEVNTYFGLYNMGMLGHEQQRWG